MTVQQENRYLDLLINPSFQGVDRLFALSFENKILSSSSRNKGL